MGGAVNKIIIESKEKDIQKSKQHSENHKNMILKYDGDEKYKKTPYYDTYEQK